MLAILAALTLATEPDAGLTDALTAARVQRVVTGRRQLLALYDDEARRLDLLIADGGPIPSVNEVRRTLLPRISALTDAGTEGPAISSVATALDTYAKDAAAFEKNHGPAAAKLLMPFGEEAKGFRLKLLEREISLMARLQPPFKGAFKDLALADAPTKLLGGALTIRLPVGAQVQARSTDLMSAAVVDADETRAFVDRGKERVVIFAVDLNARSPEGIEALRAAAEEELTARNEKPFALAPLVLDQAFKGAIAWQPKVLDLSREAIPVQGAFVVSRDGTVQEVTVYANAEAAKDEAGVRQLARRVLGALAPGSRQSRTGAVPVSDFGLGLQLDVPANARLSTRLGHDFVVHRVALQRNLGGSERGVLALYLGGHPSRIREKDEPAQTRAGRVLGHDVQWTVFKRGTTSIQEAIFDCPFPGGERVVAHLHLTATSDDALADLQRSMALIKMLPPPAKP